jgi:hypothetical protein
LIYDYIKFLVVRKNLDMNEVRRLYLEENQTASQIGEQFGVSKQMILSRLRRLGVRRTPERGRTPDNFRYPEPAYGLRVSDGRLVVNSREMKIVRLIVELRDRRNYKWAVVVEYLNGAGHRTRRGNCWSTIGAKRVHKRWTGKI